MPRTLPTFAFAPNTRTKHKDKVKRVQSPTLYFNFVSKIIYSKVKHSIYISYAWGDNANSAEEIALQGLCKVLIEHGFEVIYDRTHLDYHESLPVFFKTIGEGGMVIPIVGKKYFTRLNCLIEASNMLLRGDIKERIFPLVLSDNYDIYDALKRANIIKEIESYWKNKEKELKTAIDYSNQLPGSLIPLRQDLNILYQTIATITPFVNHIGTNKQFNFDDEVKSNFETFIQFIIQKKNEEIKKPFYQKIEGEYFGREDDIKFLDEFLRAEQKHFLLLLGVGGMGKSHLLSVCLDKFNYERKFFWIKADKNFELRNLFEKCNLRFPKELDDSKKICRQFLDEFSSNNLFLIIDDFYEIIDTNIREMLKELACLPSGKLLIISRAIPKEIESQKVYHHQILPLGKDDFKKAMTAYISTEEKRKFTDTELDKIFDKAQGYPLGGQLIIRLADFGDDLDQILNNIPKYEAELDSEGKRFSERLLDNIFEKSNAKEIKLLCEFSALIGFPLIEEIRQLPSFKLDNLYTLLNRRKFIKKDETGKYSAHAMIRDYAYEKLVDKETIHKRMGSYFEKKLIDKKEIDWEIAETAIIHFKKAGKRELELFGQRMFAQFRNKDVKSIIEQSLKNTIRNYQNLIEIYPKYMPYYNELGIAFRNNNQKQLAIDTFLKAIEVAPEHIASYNELGITYREVDEIQKSIFYCEKGARINSPDKYCHLTLLQTYLYFEVDAVKAKHYYDIVFGSNKYYDVNQHLYRKEIRKLNSIWNLEFSEVIKYRNYINRAINYKAYKKILELLFELNKKFPNDSKIISRLGKTLCNKDIGREEEGRVYIKEAISLFKRENDKKNYEEFIIYYFNGLLNNEKLELLEEEMKYFGYDLKLNSAYYTFTAIYYQKLGKSENEIIKTYIEANSKAITDEEKIKAAESFLHYLDSVGREKYELLFAEMTGLITELVHKVPNTKLQ